MSKINTFTVFNKNLTIAGIQLKLLELYAQEQSVYTRRRLHYAIFALPCNVMSCNGYMVIVEITCRLASDINIKTRDKEIDLHISIA